MLSIAVKLDENTIDVLADGPNVAVPSGTACGGVETQLTPSFQLLLSGLGDQIASVACALTAPRHTPAISPARIVCSLRRTPCMIPPPAIGIDGPRLMTPA